MLVALAQLGSHFLKEGHRLVGGEQHLGAGGGGFQRTGHVEELHALAEGEGDRTFAVTHLIGAGQGQRPDVPDKGIVGTVEGHGHGTGLDAHLGQVFIHFALQRGRYGRAGNIGEHPAFRAGGADGRSVILICTVKGDRRGIHRAGQAFKQAADGRTGGTGSAQKAAQEALCTGRNA